METNAMTREEAKASIKIGDKVPCVITHHYPFGVLVSVGGMPFWGVIERIGMERDGYHTPDEYPPIGSVINAIILGFRDRDHQLELVMPPKGTELKQPKQVAEVVEVGLRMGDDGQLDFFGVEEVNERLVSGRAVIRIEKDRAIMLRAGESQGSVRLQLKGFSVLVILSTG